MQMIYPNESSCPKVMAFLLILAFPLIIVGIVIYVVLGMLGSAFVGLFAGVIVLICKFQNIFVIVLLPLAAVIGAIVLPFFLLTTVFISSIILFFRKYFLTIRNLWSFHQN